MKQPPPGMGYKRQPKPQIQTHNSKICLSPFGMGEIGERDYESMMLGTIILKPSCERVDSYPNMMIEDETYVSCNHDWSDLEEKIDYIKKKLIELSLLLKN